MSSGGTPTLSVVVPATDGPATLERCLAAIQAARGPEPELIVEREPAGIGPAEARNRGAGRARGEVLVFVDSDVEVHADALERIRRAFWADPGLMAVFGAYDDDPEPPEPVSRFRNLLHHHVHATGAGLAETFWAGLGAVRAEAFAEAGGFDAERYPSPAIEDVELGMRLSSAGARILLDPSIRGRHLKRWSLGGMVRTDLARRGVPWVELQLERRAASSALNLGWRHRLSALASLAAAVSAARRRPGAALAACGALVVLNAGFYRLLARRGGPALVAAGVPLHLVHHLSAVAAVPVGIVAHVLRGRWGGREREALSGEGGGAR